MKPSPSAPPLLLLLPALPLALAACQSGGGAEVHAEHAEHAVVEEGGGHHGHHGGHGGHGGHGHMDRHHSFADVERYAARFEAPERAEWQRPDQVVAQLGLEEGQRVADIGAGTGYFAVRMSPAVGESGRVYAVDIEPNMVEYLRQRAEREGLPNLTPVLAQPRDPSLPEAVDLVFICDTWHHIDERRAYLRGLLPRLRPGARVAIVDFHRDMEIPIHAPPPQIRLSSEEVIAEFEAEGFRLLEQPSILPYQYVLIFGAPEGE